MSDFKIGPVQEQWLNNLEAYPERQCTGIMGRRKEGTQEYVACCLGELFLTYRRIKGLPESFDDAGYLYDGDDNQTLSNSFLSVGLHDGNGSLYDPVTGKLYSVDGEHTCLAGMNDDGWTWIEIATFVREHPELVFIESV